MKKKIQFVVFVIFSLVVVQPASGQKFLEKFGKKVKNKIEKKVENKVDEKVDEKIDEKIDQVFDEDEPSAQTNEEKQQERLQKMMKGIGLSGEPVPIADNYLFDSKIQMHIESYKANGELDNEGDFITYINPDSKNFAYQFVSGDYGQKGKGMFIMDFENSAMIILSDEDGKKSGIVYGMNLDMGEMMDEAYNDLDEDEIKNVNMNPYLDKTGRTKTISGYKCDEYKYDNPEEDTEARFWVSQKANFKTRDYMSTIFKSAAYSRGMPCGFIMESEAINKKNKERSVMKVTDMDDNANKKFNLSDFQITNLGSVNIPDMEE